MYDAHGVVAVTDWEMAHYGDLHDDLAWIYVRDVQERFTDLRDRVRDYERFSGNAVDPRRFRYFLVLAQARCAIGTRNGLLARDSRGEMANHLIYTALHERLLVEALAQALGVDLPAPEPLVAAAETPRSWAFDVALADLRENVLPSVESGFAQRRAKGIARLLKYLREEDRLGAVVERAELAALSDLLGTPVDDRAQGDRALCERIASGDIDDAAVLRYFAQSQARALEILRPAMGSLADRHYSPLPE
jgi:aminoglycoside phosphotransferase (APT) family kinase protein